MNSITNQLASAEKNVASLDSISLIQPAKEGYVQVAIWKIFLLGIVTFNLYGFIWFRRNWKIFQRRNDSYTIPLWVRSLFFPVTCLPLLTDVYKNRNHALIILAGQWLLIIISFLTSYHIILMQLLSCTLQAAWFALVQQKINSPLDEMQTDKPTYRMSFSTIITCVVFGSIWMAGIILTN